MKHNELPIVPHEDGCCGCLIVVEFGDYANLVCNECGALIRTVPTDEAPKVLLRMAMDQGMCSATCGALNTFPGFTGIEAYICRECGQGVSVRGKVQ
jgi:hypothetical protein